MKFHKSTFVDGVGGGVFLYIFFLLGDRWQMVEFGMDIQGVLLGLE